jgi:hypothetical protein
LFLPGGILAVTYDEKKARRRKAVGTNIRILKDDTINTIEDWNNRLHQLRDVLRDYENDLPVDVRTYVDEIAQLTDIHSPEWGKKLDQFRQYLKNSVHQISAWQTAVAPAVASIIAFSLVSAHVAFVSFLIITIISKYHQLSI